MLRSLPLFAAEAVVEGVAACLSSGTDSAYLYAVYGRENYLAKTAHAANFGTAGFLISTAAYAVLYQAFGLTGLLTATVISGAAGLFCSFLLRQEPRQEVPVPQQGSMWKRLRVIFGSRQALLFTGLLSAFSVAWLLVNFFYAEKLEGCGIPLAWLSAVIMGYSAAQMLAEPILCLCAGRSRGAMTAVFCLLSGAGDRGPTPPTAAVRRTGRSTSPRLWLPAPTRRKGRSPPPGSHPCSWRTAPPPGHYPAPAGR